jgi:DNA-binding protein HU-beta
MNKLELIDALSKDTMLTKADCEHVLNSLIEVVRVTVEAGDDVKIKDFGTFTKYLRAARTGRNPRSGQEIQIPAAYYPKFRASGLFVSLITK